MAEREQSFPDRIQKTTQLIAAAGGLSPAYAPADAAYNIANVTTKNAACETLNNNVANAQTTWSNNAQARVTHALLIKDRATQLLNFIKSNTAWKTQFVRAKQLADAVRGVRLPKAPAPPPPPGQPPTVARQKGAQSYSEIEQNWRSLVTLATGLPAFTPPLTNLVLQPAALTATSTLMSTLNDTVAANEEALSNARQLRLDGYFGTDGLETKFAGMKQAIKGQYGTRSPQYAQVKSLKW